MRSRPFFTDLLLKIEQRTYDTLGANSACTKGSSKSVTCLREGTTRISFRRLLFRCYTFEFSRSLTHTVDADVSRHRRCSGLSLSLSGWEKSLPLRKMIWAGIGSKELLDPRSRALEVLSEEVWAV